MSKTIDLNVDLVTFGKYKNKYLSDVLRDRSYCKWLLNQDWFSNYSYLHSVISEYNPSSFFFISNDTTHDENANDFLKKYQYFNLRRTSELQIQLNDEEKLCYKFYKKMIKRLKERIIKRKDELENNIYDIKAPVNFLKELESEYKISRETFKNFLQSYELQSILEIVEDIKKEGKIEYNSNKSFKIGKERSKKQECFWEEKLREKYNDNISSQFKFENCFFDFLNIHTNTIYECKLGLKDFNEEQYKKYTLILQRYKIIYLIDNDCLIDISTNKLYSLNTDKYNFYISKIPVLKKQTWFDIFLQNIEIQDVDHLKLYCDLL